MSVEIRIGDCRDLLVAMPDQSVNCCITSPPYFGQRDYGIDSQMGLEPTPEAFVAGMVSVFSEVRRVLRADGTLWLNLGDSFNNRTRIRPSSHKPVGSYDRKSWAQSAADGEVRMTITSNGWKEKDAFGIPWAVANALRKHGWYLRQEIIWHKPVAKLDVAGDRPSTRHEHIFLLSKSKRYYFNAAALPAWARGSVWSVAATGSRSHGAAFPEKLVEPCILAGCPADGIVLDPFGGVGTTGVAAGRLQRRAIIIELNPEYAATARSMVEKDGGLFASVAAA